MKIAVIDDERPSRSELCHLIREHIPDVVLEEADSGYGALELAAKHSFDAIFLDIHLGDITGTKLSVMLNKFQPEVPIVFATAYDEYALKAFDLGAFDYIMKPFDAKRVAQTLDKLMKNNAENRVCKPDLTMSDKLSVQLDKSVVMLDIKEIAYVEALDGNCIIHSKGKQYTCTQPLSFFEQRLSSFRFFRIHKSFVINLNDVVEFAQWTQGTYCVKLKGYEKTNLPISRKQIKLLKDAFDM